MATALGITQEKTERPLQKPAANKKGPKAPKEPKAPPVPDPANIVRLILEKSTYHEPNLSELIDNQIHTSNGYYTTNLDYPVTVGFTAEGIPDVACTVYPTDFDGTVNLNPDSIVILPCIHSTFPKSNRRFRRRGPQNRPNNNSSSNNNNNNSKSKRDTTSNNNNSKNDSTTNSNRSCTPLADIIKPPSTPSNSVPVQ